MATFEQESTTQAQQIEQNSTPESRVEISQKDQELDEVVIDSKKHQEILINEQNVKAESQTLAKDIKTESETIEQGVKTETKALEEDVKTEIKTIEEGVKTETKTLEEGVKTHEATPKELSDREIAKIKDSATLKAVANERIEKCENLMSGIQSAEGSGTSRSELKEKMRRSIKDMKKMVKDIEKMEKKGQYYSNTDNYKNRLGEIIFDYYSSREPARQDIVMGIRVPMIKGTTDSKRDARKDKNYAKDNAEYQIDLSEIRKNAAIYSMIGVNADEWGDYCDFIGEGGIAIGHPVYLQHTAGFNQVRQYNPDLYDALTPEGQITYNTYCQRDPARYEAYCRNNNIVCRPRTFNSKIGHGVADIAEYLGANKDNDPRKRQAREKAGSVVALGGAIVLGFQFLKNLFSSKKDNPDKRRNVGLFGAGLLGVLNLDKLANRVQDITGWHPAEKSRMLAESFRTYGFSDAQAMEMVDRYVGAPVTTMAALHFIPIYELESQHILENRNGEFEFNYKNYETYVNKFSWDNEQKKHALDAGKKLDKDKSVGTGLKAFGIATRDKLRSLFGSDKKKTLADTDEVKEGRGKMVEKVQHGVNKELYNNGLMLKNPEDIDLIMKEYDEGKDKIGANKLILKRMKEGLLEFNANKEYTMEDMLSNSDIDLENMTIKGFKSGDNDVKFNSYGELFDTYFLTEKIKYQFEGVPAKSNEPFKINTLGQLKFDDKNWYEFFSGDTTVISRKAFTNDFPTLKENRDYYVDYLNARRQGKNDVDVSQLDIVSKLGINFYSEKEAKALNATLKKIKDDLRYYHPTKYGDPFEIKDGVLKIKIEFTTIGESKKTRDISGLKTFSNETNKEKLLKYLNDETNKMWGSSL